MGQGTPFHVVPLAGEGQVQADINAGVLPEQPGGFGEPSGDSHHFNAGLNTFCVALQAGDVSRPERAHIVCPDNQSGVCLLADQRHCAQPETQ